MREEVRFNDMANHVIKRFGERWQILCLISAIGALTLVAALNLSAFGRAYLEVLITKNQAVFDSSIDSIVSNAGVIGILLSMAAMATLTLGASVIWIRAAVVERREIFQGGIFGLGMRMGRLALAIILWISIAGLVIAAILVALKAILQGVNLGGPKLLYFFVGFITAFTFVMTFVSALYGMYYEVALDRTTVLRSVPRILGRLTIKRVLRVMLFMVIVGICFGLAFYAFKSALGIFLEPEPVVIISSVAYFTGVSILSGLFQMASGQQFSDGFDTSDLGQLDANATS